jgi:hypothetical protein
LENFSPKSRKPVLFPGRARVVRSLFGAPPPTNLARDTNSEILDE